MRYVVVNAESFAICGTEDDGHIVFRLHGRPVFSVPEADYLGHWGLEDDPVIPE